MKRRPGAPPEACSCLLAIAGALPRDDNGQQRSRVAENHVNKVRSPTVQRWLPPGAFLRQARLHNRNEARKIGTMSRRELFERRRLGGYLRGTAQ